VGEYSLAKTAEYTRIFPSIKLKTKSALLILWAPNAVSHRQLTVYKPTVFNYFSVWYNNGEGEGAPARQ